MFGTRQLTYNSKQYRADEVVSALQKEIRRCDEKAFYWGEVLYANGYWNAAFNRLKVITIEDCEASLLLPLVIEEAYEKGKAAIKGKKVTESKDFPECKEALLSAIYNLINSKKSRCLNHALVLTRKSILTKTMAYDENLVDEEAKAEALASIPNATQALDNFTTVMKAFTHYYESENDVRALSKDTLREHFFALLEAGLCVVIWNVTKNKKEMWKLICSIANADFMGLSEPEQKTITVLSKWGTVNESLALAQALTILTKHHDGFDSETEFKNGVVEVREIL